MKESDLVSTVYGGCRQRSGVPAQVGVGNLDGVRQKVSSSL